MRMITALPRKWNRLPALVALALITAGCSPMAPTGPERGRVLYDACSVCHGVDGGGNAELRVPGIAGMPSWYLRSQLTKFDEGWRAYHVDDYDGIRMRPMLLTLRETRRDGTKDEIATAVNIDAVAQYIERLPPVEPPVTVDGDAAAGQITYATCSACHGPAGEGNEALGSPPIANLHDWYVVSSLKQYQAGIRGAHPEDAVGATMQAISMVVADEQAMKNVAAYIRTFDEPQVSAQ